MSALLAEAVFGEPVRQIFNHDINRLLHD